MKILIPQSASVALAGVLALSVAGCGGTADEVATPDATGTVGLSGSITVFAAASLTATFTELAENFETENPGTTVELNFAGSSDLVTQITEGAPADVFASADTNNMTKLVDASLIDGEPVNFATNVLQIVVPRDNPANIATLADLAEEGINTVICAEQVPCGSATVRVEEAAGIDINPVSEESSVTDVLGKVTSGEADAGLVYVTDVTAAGDAVEGIEFDESSEAVNTYPMATVVETEAKEIADAFIAYVTSDEGQQVLQDAGFGAP